MTTHIPSRVIALLKFDVDSRRSSVSLRRIGSLVLAQFLALWLLTACGDSSEDASTTMLTHALGTADTSGFARAYAPREFRFPEDHGPHPEYRTEWWYYTGNLRDEHGRNFGYQLTFFRNALAPASARGIGDSTSTWRARDMYFAHFALSDIDGESFHPFERYARGAAGLAGANAMPLHVWVEHWQVRQQGDTTVLFAEQDGVAIDLRLVANRAPILQGDRGLSRKSIRPGNASYYYSIPRLATTGRVELFGTVFTVSGLSWLDREWSSSVLDTGQVGWDWFALQLDDGRDIMLYQMRRNDGSVDSTSAGTIVTRDGASTPLRHVDYRIEVRDTWTSPQSGKRYPSGWHIVIPSHNIALEVRPAQQRQELPFAVTYWEGAVRCEGPGISGRGYVELTGY